MTRNIAYQKLKNSRSDLDSGEEPPHRAQFMSAHIPLQDVVNAANLQSNSSSNILVEPSMISSPAGTLSSNRRFERRSELTGRN